MSNKSETVYKIVHIELEDPLPEVTVASGYSGLGCVVRRNGKPVGYLMAAIAGIQSEPADIARTESHGELYPCGKDSNCGRQIVSQCPRSTLQSAPMIGPIRSNAACPAFMSAD